MALAYEKNVDLAIDTTILREYGNRYTNIADELRSMSKDLDDKLQELIDDGWTTPAGTAFHKMTKTNWSDNIEKYASLLDTLCNILSIAAEEYDVLVCDSIEVIQLGDRTMASNGGGGRGW